MQHSECFTAIATALAKASAAFGPINRNREVLVTMRTGGSYTFWYATLDAIVAAVRPALSANGLVLVQSVVSMEVPRDEALDDGTTVRVVDREDMLETRLLHESGEWLANLTPVLIAAGENSAQAYGSGITYARRYGITQLLCVVADEDDDGNAGSGNVQRQRTSSSASAPSGARGGVISEKQVGLLVTRLRQAKSNAAVLCGVLGVDSLETLPRSRMDEAIAAIDAGLPASAPEGKPDGGNGNGSKIDPAKRDACRLAFEQNSESMLFIRKHLGPGGYPEKAAAEWRLLELKDQEALWLAPTKGGWFTTEERDLLRKSLAAHPIAPATEDPE